MSRFDDCLKFILAREGGYTNDPLDRGGATNFGITQREYTSWLLARFSPPKDIKDISAVEVEAIYRENYWRACRADILGRPLDLVMFDTAVQHGPKRAVKMLQQAAHVDADGIFGPITIGRVETTPASLLAYRVLDIRRRFYRDIVADDPSQERFEKGWDNRMALLTQEARLT